MVELFSFLNNSGIHTFGMDVPLENEASHWGPERCKIERRFPASLYEKNQNFSPPNYQYNWADNYIDNYPNYNYTNNFSNKMIQGMYDYQMNFMNQFMESMGVMFSSKE